MRTKLKEKTAFTIVRKGYAKKEVDDFISAQEEQKQRTFAENSNRAVMLKNRIADLECEIAELNSREDEIKKSLYAANDKANEMTMELKIQYALEIERLKIFQAKWTNCYEELKERYHFGKDALNMESVVAATSLELENMLSRDFSLPKSNTCGEIEKQFKREVERLGIEDSELASLFEKLKSELKNATALKSEKRECPASKIATDDENNFSFYRATHPEQPLEDICKDLGIKG